jgi:hypothetical protein
MYYSSMCHFSKKYLRRNLENAVKVPVSDILFRRYGKRLILSSFHMVLLLGKRVEINRNSTVCMEQLNAEEIRSILVHLNFIKRNIIPKLYLLLDVWHI